MKRGEQHQNHDNVNFLVPKAHNVYTIKITSSYCKREKNEIVQSFRYRSLHVQRQTRRRRMDVDVHLNMCICSHLQSLLKEHNRI